MRHRSSILSSAPAPTAKICVMHACHFYVTHDVTAPHFELDAWKWHLFFVEIMRKKIIEMINKIGRYYDLSVNE